MFAPNNNGSRAVTRSQNVDSLSDVSTDILSVLHILTNTASSRYGRIQRIRSIRSNF